MADGVHLRLRLFAFHSGRCRATDGSAVGHRSRQRWRFRQMSLRCEAAPRRVGFWFFWKPTGAVGQEPEWAP